jgi:hypothetical protein
VGGLVSHSNYGSRPLWTQSRIYASSTRPEPTLRIEPWTLHRRAPEDRACRRGPVPSSRPSSCRSLDAVEGSPLRRQSAAPGPPPPIPEKRTTARSGNRSISISQQGNCEAIRPRRLRCCRLTLHLSPTRPLTRCPHGFKSPLSYSSSSGSAWRRVEDDAEILRNSACDVPVWCQWVSVSEPLSS